MKKYLIGLFALALFVSVGAEKVSANCGDPIYDQSTTTLIQIGITQCGNSDPMLVTMPWGLTGQATPKVKAGATVIDEGGITDTCPSWYNIGMGGCFDLTHTDYYRHAMTLTARQEIDRGVDSQFPQMRYWHAKAR